MFPSPAPHSTPSTSGDIQLLSFWDWPLTSVMSQLGKGLSILAPLHRLLHPELPCRRQQCPFWARQPPKTHWPNLSPSQGSPRGQAPPSTVKWLSLNCCWFQERTNTVAGLQSSIPDLPMLQN